MIYFLYASTWCIQLYLSGVHYMSKIKSKDFYIVESNALPNIILKVVEAKCLLESGKAKTVQSAADTVGISRSAFYKYKDSVFHFFENTQNRTVTVAFNLQDTPGFLSDVLNAIAEYGANILTINQTIPINHVANVTITMEIRNIINIDNDVSTMLEKLEKLNGVQSLKIIAHG